MKTHSEKRKMIAIVNELCHAYGRPVCSSDLKVFFARYPDRRPCLLQRLGQILVKCGYPMTSPANRIYPVGIHRCRAYYAPDIDPFWKKEFRQHVIRDRLQEEIAGHFTDHALQLLKGPNAALARNALAGWLEETGLLLRELKDQNCLIAQSIGDLRNEIRLYASPVFIKHEPLDLISKNAAGRFLKEEFIRRNPHCDVNHLSFCRLYKNLRWPQSDLFPKQNPPVYWPSQLAAFVRFKWPLNEDDFVTEKARWFCLRYGDANEKISTKESHQESIKFRGQNQAAFWSFGWN
ncbi:MAG: hypothetical protein PHV34_21655 [Verrucomicrobiae bacterium]|nr:hypothetical protein [Verrucomicrobiae bacterium]